MLNFKDDRRVKNDPSGFVFHRIGSDTLRYSKIFMMIIMLEEKKLTGDVMEIDFY